MHTIKQTTMKLTEIKGMDYSKCAIIDVIMTRHPSYGVPLGLAQYTGGFVDNGNWFVDKLAEKSFLELSDILRELDKKD